MSHAQRKMPVVESPKLVRLGEGAYSVSSVCRVLQPGMTPRKVHYWLDTGLLSPAVIKGSRGTPTILSFRQMLEIRTVQHLREELRFSLGDVREAIRYVLERQFGADWTRVRLARGVGGGVVVAFGSDTVNIKTNHSVLEGVLPELSREMMATREAWEQRAFRIPSYPEVVSNARVQGGSPTVAGTRLETAFLASLVVADRYDQESLRSIKRQFPRLSSEAIKDALEFEGVLAAA